MRAMRHPATVLLAASLLAACSTSGSQLAASTATATGDTNGSSTTPATTSATSAAPSGTSSSDAFSSAARSPAPGTTGAAAPTGASSTAAPAALPTDFLPLDQVIRDPDLGHEVKVLRLARNLPWPSAQADEAGSLELVGVEMTWTPGTTYTATLRTVDFALGTSSAYPNRPDAILNPSLQAAGWSLLPAEMPTGQSGTGWIVFRVEPKGSPALRLDYTRPASRVTDNGQVFPKTVFSAQLVG